MHTRGRMGYPGDLQTGVSEPNMKGDSTDKHITSTADKWHGTSICTSGRGPQTVLLGLSDSPLQNYIGKLRS